MTIDANGAGILPVTPDDLAEGSAIGGALLALNNAHAVELSWLDANRFRHLASEAFLALRIGEADALLLCFDQNAQYDSPNFLWFRDRFQRYVYVDRIVVAGHTRGRRLARLFYGELFAKAKKAEHDRIVCEVNVDPPNPASMAFHAAQGFVEIGRERLKDGKIVAYLACDIT